MIRESAFKVVDGGGSRLSAAEKTDRWERARKKYEVRYNIGSQCFDCKYVGGGTQLILAACDKIHLIDQRVPRGPHETGSIVASTCYKDMEDNNAKRLAVHQGGSVFAVTGPDGCRLFDMRMLSDASAGGQTRCLYTCKPRTEV